MDREEKVDEMIEFLNTGPFAKMKKWGTKWSLWPVHLVTACCGVELAHAYASGYDGERLGSLNFGISRQTNLIVVEGAITRKMAKVLKITYEQMPDPKFVIVMGACGLRGGLFWNGYHMVNPSEVVPVKYLIPGCPPTPEGLLRAIRTLQNEITDGKAQNTIEFKEYKFEDVKRARAKLTPPSPKRVARNPAIVIDYDRSDIWREGEDLLKKIKEDFGDLIKNAVIIGKNRICVSVDKEKLRDVAVKARDMGFDHVKSVNVIDVIHENKFIVEYHVSSYTREEYISLILNIKTEVERENARVSSLADIWPSSDYMEREMYELFGVYFEGNPWMGRNFLLSPDTPKFPLRKDFKLDEDTYIGGEG